MGLINTYAEKFKNDLLNIARTTLSSKLVHSEKDFFAKLCVDAVLRLKGNTNLEAIHIIKKTGGSLRDSYLEVQNMVIWSSFERKDSFLKRGLELVNQRESRTQRF